MIHALVINTHANTKLQALRATAEANVVSFAEMYRRAAEFEARGGRQEGEQGRSDMTVFLRVGYACTFTVEEHRQGVPCRHLSVSGPNQLPAPQAVEMLMKIMGFQNDLLVCKVWTEEVGPDRHAVNVLEPIGDNWAPLMVPVEGTMQ
jgi:hypothetical protein